MLKLYRILALSLVTTLIFSVGQTQDLEVDCSLSNVLTTLSNVDLAQQDDDLETATAELANAITELNNINENCTIEPIETELSATEDEIPMSDDPMLQPKGDGFYLVGVDIATGKWESIGTESACYWEVTTRDGDIVKNHFGIAGGTVTLNDSDFQVEFSDCGEFIYVDNLDRTLSTGAESPKDSGFYTVGVEIATGLWRSTGDSSSCYYAKLDTQQDTIDNHFGNSGVTIDILPTDYEIHFDDCGTWEYLGQ